MASRNWPDAVDLVLAGDHVAMLGYLTPAGGVVLTPVTNFGLRDRAAGTVAFNTSVGAARKLERLAARPEVALAFHTRAHADHDRPEYVLVQGHATLGPPVDDYPSTILDRWERFEPWGAHGPLRRRWLRVYGRRVEVTLAVDRITVWPDLACAGPPTVHGTPRPDAPPPAQRAPRNGTGPRVGTRRTAWEARRLPSVLAGWRDADGLPTIVPVQVAHAPAGLTLTTAAPDLLPPGARRAGLTAHWFSRGVTGQRQIVHTGWLDGTTYAPHTRAAYAMPPSRLVYTVAVGAFTRLRARPRR